MSGKPKVEERTKTKAITRVFASTRKIEKKFECPSCILCKGKHALWKRSMFKEKTPTQRAKFSEENKLCFFCLQGNHAFGSVLVQRNTQRQDALAPIVYNSMVLNVFILVKIQTKLTATQPLVKQEIMPARIKRSQARIHQTQVRVM